MSLRKDWEAAKKTSIANFKAAYKAYVLDLATKAEEKDPKARAILLNQNLADLGLSQGDNLIKYCKFDEGLGPALDAWENQQKINEEVYKVTGNINDIDIILKNGKLSAAFAKYCKSQVVSENLTFYTTGYKLAPAAAYDSYVKTKAKLELNLPGPLKKRWEDGAADKWKKDGKSLLTETRAAAYADLAGHIQSFGLTEDARTAMGYKDNSAAKKKALDICVSYSRQVAAYGKRWANFQPDFWTPALKTLNEIVDTINKARK